ncbi:MAG: GNAT family N-acetyltransferase [Paenibacillus sp.]|uniref:GNAT family N-acetyltransferase n=1 Tax=Paenibacillus sp. TaxID=58172 RepID=UPI0025D1C8EE|nr:GNAT family N-acetyltransferase [Paenibacillus sp.]MBR2564027.1 GNAT family N-acetyltransferase [Paenibacillus sp.]
MILITKAEQQDKSILKNVMTLFLHDLSEFNQDIEMNPQNGLFELDVLDWFFEKEGLTPYFIRLHDQKIIGFILVQSGSFSNQEFADYVLNSFFIMKNYRRQGLGRAACKELFKHLPGRYAVGQLTTNIPAIQFWKNVYTSFDIDFYEQEEKEDSQTLIYQYFKV